METPTKARSRKNASNQGTLGLNVVKSIRSWILNHKPKYKIKLFIVRWYMNLWGVTVLELDSHPDRNEGPDYALCACL